MLPSNDHGGVTADQRGAIDRLSNTLGLPSEADGVANAAEAATVIAELSRLQRRLCWRAKPE